MIIQDSDDFAEGRASVGDTGDSKEK